MLRIERLLLITPLLIPFGTFSCSDGEPTGAAVGGSPDDAAGGGAGGSIVGPPRVPGTDEYACAPAEGTMPALALRVVATGFDQPLFIAHPPNDTERLLVLERGGLIRLMRRTGSGSEVSFETSEAPFLDLRERVTTTGPEQGLWGLAFHPDHIENGKLYVFYATAASDDTEEGDLLVEEYEAEPSGNSVDATTARRVFHVPHPRPIHYGGTLAFGPDGYLYISSGDGKPKAAEEQLTAQDPGTVYGKILRIDPRPSGDEPYSTPADNLIADEPTAAPEVWDRGLRNPYRMNFDACTGDLFIADVGERSWEEVNIEAAGRGHKNYGWPLMEGEGCFPATTDCDPQGLTLPLAVLPTVDPAASIVGGSVYRGSKIPALRGTYFFGITQTGSVHTLRFDGEKIGPVSDVSSDVNPDGDEREVITSIQSGGDGELYFTGFISGRVLTLVAE